MLNMLRMFFISLLILGFIGCGDSSTDETPNKAPNAKTSSSISNGTVTLDASTSTDSDGNIVKYEWYEDNTLIGEEKVLKKSDFTKGKHTITLKVTDDKGVSSKTTTTFTIENQPPTAKIKTLSSVQEDTSFTLDGSNSNDSDGEIVKYDWYDGDTLLGSGKTFKASLSGARIHKITLKVTDDNGAISSDTVIITITEKSNPSPTNVAPVANAGADQSVQENQNVTLNGSASSDSDGTIVKYEWFENGSSLSKEKTYTTKDLDAGIHNITLKVTDDDGATSSDTVIITITQKNINGTVLLGNISNATVNTYKISNDGNKTLLWTETTSKGNILEDIGKFNLRINDIIDNNFYLYEAIGGDDWDANDDGIKDSTSTQNKGKIRMFIKGKDIKSLGQNLKVTIFSEIIYQKLLPLMSKQELLEKELHNFASDFVGDINQDGKIDYIDLGQYNPKKDEMKTDLYTKNEIQNLIGKIHNNESILPEIEKKNNHLIASIDLSAYGNSSMKISKDNTKAYVRIGSKLKIISIKDNKFSVLSEFDCKSIDSGCYLNQAILDDNKIYLSANTNNWSTNNNYIFTIDIQNPNTPSLINTYKEVTPNDWFMDLELYDNDSKLILAKKNKIEILDISQPSNITKLAEYNQNDVKRFILSEDETKLFTLSGY